MTCISKIPKSCCSRVSTEPRKLKISKKKWGRGWMETASYKGSSLAQLIYLQIDCPVEMSLEFFQFTPIYFPEKIFVI